MTRKPCNYCIDGFMPAGISPTLGPIYRACDICVLHGAMAICTGCYGAAVFPADFKCRHCLAAHLESLGLVPAFCTGCAGVWELLPFDAIPEDPDA